jgi:hypothetical protein
MKQHMSDRPVVSFQAVRALRYALVPLAAMMLASGILIIPTLRVGTIEHVQKSADFLEKLLMSEVGYSPCPHT